jgi:hypothetical protein
MIDSTNIVPKIHPASREVLPDDPLEMQAFEMSGDQELMIRMMVEEYARIGWSVEEIMRLACDPNYFAFHSLYLHFGESELRHRLERIISRCGVMRVRMSETIPLSESLVQINLPT